MSLRKGWLSWLITAVAPSGTRFEWGERGDGYDEGSRMDAAPRVDMIATPDDGSCGIGTYTGDLTESFEGLYAEHVVLDQNRQRPGYFAELAVQAAASESDVVHVQHEYGLFRRDGSPWPGVMGLVFFPLLFLLAELRGKAVVVTFHSALNPDPGEAPLGQRLYLELMHRLIAAGADHLIFLSEECSRAFRRDVPLEESQYTLLPHGVNRHDAIDVDEATAKATFGYDPDDTVIMIPGYLREPKGHHLFVEVARGMPDCEFLVAGGARPGGAPEEKKYAERIAAEAPENVRVTGVLEDRRFHAAFNAADLILLPYLVVSQSGTFNWCAAHERPVLASDVGYFERMAQRWENVELFSIEEKEAAITDAGALREEELAAIRERIERITTSEERTERLVEAMRQYNAAVDLRNVAERHREIYEAVADAT